MSFDIGTVDRIAKESFAGRCSASRLSNAEPTGWSSSCPINQTRRWPHSRRCHQRLGGHRGYGCLLVVSDVTPHSQGATVGFTINFLRLAVATDLVATATVRRRGGTLCTGRRQRTQRRRRGGRGGDRHLQAHRYRRNTEH